MASQESGTEVTNVQASESALEREKSIERIIRAALLHYLDGYNVRVLPFYADWHLVVHNLKGRMGLVRQPEIMVMPDIRGENLVYYKKPHHSYTLYISTKGGKARFLYGWYSGGKPYVTFPYHDSQTKDETPVLCHKPIDISDLIKAKHPVRAFEVLLDGLKVGEEAATNGFKSDGYLWFAKGTEEFFQVSTSDSDDSLHWRDQQDGVTNLRYTNKTALAVELEFRET